MILKCFGCGHRVEYGKERPEKCAYCGTPISPKPYKLSEQDRRFLRSLRIMQDVPSEE